MEEMNERYAIENDTPVEILFPKIANNKVPLLLIYEANEAFHNNKIKDFIILFLIGQNAQDIEAYTNSSIYFKLDGEYSKEVFQKLNTDFAIYINRLEKKFEGKIFWVFNYLVKFTTTPQEIGMVGRGNQSFYDRFKILRDKLIKKFKDAPTGSVL